MKKIILSTVCLAVMTTFAALSADAASVLDKVQRGVDKTANTVVKADKAVTTTTNTAKSTAATAKSTATSTKAAATTTAKSTTTAVQKEADNQVAQLEKQRDAALAKIQKKIDAAKADVKTLESSNATVTDKAKAIKNMNKKTFELRKEYRTVKNDYNKKIKAAKKASK